MCLHVNLIKVWYFYSLGYLSVYNSLANFLTEKYKVIYTRFMAFTTFALYFIIVLKEYVLLFFFH